VARWFETRGWRDQPASEKAALLFAPIADVAPDLIEHRWRQSRKRSRKFDELSNEQRHRLRIALKKLRYTIEFLGSLYEHRHVKKLEKKLKRLQDDLGAINDIRTARGLIAQLPELDGPETVRAGGILLGWHDRGLIDREPKLRKDVRRLRRAKRFWSPRPDLKQTLRPEPHGNVAHPSPETNADAVQGHLTQDSR
jgi:triphosphatase